MIRNLLICLIISLNLTALKAEGKPEKKFNIIEKAIYFNDKDFLEKSLSKGWQKKFTQFQFPPLFFAIMLKRNEMVKILIEKGKVDINEIYNDLSPLAFAVSFNLREVVEILVQNGADLKFKTKTNINLSDIALQKGYTDLFFRLRRLGAPLPSIKNNSSQVKKNTK